jgi:hypothetical protein
MPARPVAQGPALFPSGVVCERYRIDAVLGVGGTGTVFRAHDLVAGADVALKAIPHDAVLRQRARREVAVAGRLDHEHVVRLLDVAEDDDYVYVASEFVDGGDLALALRGGQVGDIELLRIVGAVCDALAHAHANGVVHRDVKPANVLLASDGGVRLADFGISAISDPEATVDDRLLGTLSYMAPETCRGERPAAPADVWAVGVLLYEGLTGVNPFRARRPGELLDRQARPPRPLGEVRPDLPRGLVSACGRALSTDPRRRPSAAALRDAVDAAAELLARADDATRVVPLRFARPGTRSRPDLASVGEALRRAGDAVAACHVPEGRPQRALAVAERGVPALAAGVFVGAVLRTLPFWPPGWVLPLAVLCAVVALVAPWPAAGLSLALIVPAVGNESAGLAWVLAGLGVAWLAVSAGSGRRALLPALAPPLVALLALPLWARSVVPNCASRIRHAVARLDVGSRLLTNC